MLASEPLVTIAVASFNNEKYILETLESINVQTYNSIELIIIDDCSKDNSRNIIQNWLPSSKFPTKLIFNEENKGIPKVCNIILNACDVNSKFLFLIGSDDLFFKDRVEKQVGVLKGVANDVAATFGDAEIINEKGETVHKSHYKMMGRDFSYHQKLFSNPDSNAILQEVIYLNRIPAITVTYKISILKSLGGWDESLFIEDLDMNLRIIKNQYRFIPTEDLVSKYRMHSSSVTGVKKIGYLESVIRIVSKYEGINDSIDSSIGKIYNEFAFAIYQRGGKNAKMYLKKRYLFNKSMKNYLAYRIAWSGIPYSAIRRVYNLFFKHKF